ncbi:hypothetical protein FRB93_009603 [Tulasnella sp. JGI-2019a]|nr:hypothetical protein FRB93_009603 [Tulasnella sp. JGI-2019a]
MRFPDLTAPFLLFLATTPVVGAPTDFQYVRQYNDQRDSSSTLHHRSPKALNKNSGPYDHQRRSVHTMPDVLRSKLTKRILAPAEVEAVAHDLFGAIKTKLKPGHTIADIHFTSLENGKFKATGISKNAEGHLHQITITRKPTTPGGMDFVDVTKEVTRTRPKLPTHAPNGQPHALDVSNNRPLLSASHSEHAPHTEAPSLKEQEHNIPKDEMVPETKKWSWKKKGIVVGVGVGALTVGYLGYKHFTSSGPDAANSTCP